MAHIAIDVQIDRLQQLSTKIYRELRSSKNKFFDPAWLDRYIMFEGCTSDEIALVKSAQNVHNLPEDYEQFLRRVGKRCGNYVLRGEDFTIPDLIHLKSSAATTLQREHKTLRLPEDGFVFLIDQIGNFYFFRTRADDRMIYFFSENFASESRNEFQRVAPTFTAWLSSVIDEAEELL